jgi:hypothetical protein
MNRLSILESNSSLGVRYVEEQMRTVRDALKRVEEEIGRLEGMVSSALRPMLILLANQEYAHRVRFNSRFSNGRSRLWKSKNSRWKRNDRSFYREFISFPTR